MPDKKVPPDFTRALGKFTLKMSLKDTVIAVNEINTVYITVAGTGNFLNVEPPHLSWPDSLEHFTVTSIDSIDTKKFPSAAFRTYTISFVAKQTGV